jgi:hypothetical protein
MKIIIITGAVLATLGSCAQDESAQAKETFAAKFPNAKNVKWDRESDTEWEAEFKMAGKEYSANFGNDGTWKETEYEVSKKDLPTAILTHLSTQFANAKIEEIEKVEKPDFSGYELEMEEGETTFDLVMDTAGNVISKKVLEEDED